jgi:hypothetical protein
MSAFTLYSRGTGIGSANSVGTTGPIRPHRAETSAQSEIAPTAHC